MPLRRQNHSSFEQVSDELRNLDSSKLDDIPWSTRAPVSSDKGRIWITYTPSSDTTITMYLRHPVTGTWRSRTFT